MRVVQRVFVGALLLFGAILFPAVAGADTAHADFDGDGVRDRIDISAQFRELEVRLSKSRGLQRLRSDDLIFRVVVADIDRDGDPDVVVSTRRAELQIWINTGGGVLARRSSRPAGLTHGARAAVDGVFSRGSDESACNDDQTRELIAASSPRGQPRLSSRRTAALPRALESRFQHSARTARGPPLLPHL
jgi:hypothetical protein